MITVTATKAVNSDSATGTFEFFVADPCEVADITIQTSFFIDKTFDFPLEQIKYTWVDPFV